MKGRDGKRRDSVRRWRCEEKSGKEKVDRCT
jgi:hypothetical protein